MLLSRRIASALASVLVFALVTSTGTAVRAQNAAAPFTVMPASGNPTAIPGEPVTFSVLTPEPGKSYVWVFGDGSLPVSGTRVTHIFSTVDDYAVRLSAQSPATRTELGSEVIRVTPEMRGVFAADIDGQFTPADLIQMSAVVRAPGLTSINVRTAGTLIAARTARYDITGGDDWLVMNDMRVADERDAVIREELLKKPGATVPLDSGAFTLALDYTTRSGRQVTQSYTPRVRDFFNPDQAVAISYPRITTFAGLPPDGPGNDFYYLKGDPDFNHLDDWYVRRLALEFGRRGGAWPDEPGDVAMNIFRSIDALLGDGEPGEFNNDFNIARLLDDGTLSRTRKNGEYICIAQAYLFGAMARALGIPAREYNNAIGRPGTQRADGVWRVTWWQEAGIELWYNDAWHYFDTWAGVTDRQAYLEKNLIYQSWTAFDRQSTEFKTVKGEPTKLAGHNFSVWPGEPPQWSFIEEVVRPGITVEGMLGEPSAVPITRADDAIAAGGLPTAARISDVPVAARSPAEIDIARAPGP